jgi:orotidine-5'-phosphate decarboxylase
LAKRLFEIAEAKKTNVTVSADVTTTRELLDLADRTEAVGSIIHRI